MSKSNISQKKISDLQKRYEVKTNERELKNFLKSFAFLVLALMSVYHFYASGFGTIREILHRGIHISFVVGLVFIFYSWKKICLLYTSPSPRDRQKSRMPSSA